MMTVGPVSSQGSLWGAGSADVTMEARSWGTGFEAGGVERGASRN